MVWDLWAPRNFSQTTALQCHALMNNYAHRYMGMKGQFITGEELNLLVDKAVSENTKKICYYTTTSASGQDEPNLAL